MRLLAIDNVIWTSPATTFPDSAWLPYLESGSLWVVTIAVLVGAARLTSAFGDAISKIMLAYNERVRDKHKFELEKLRLEKPLSDTVDLTIQHHPTAKGNDNVIPIKSSLSLIASER